jgi:hypothetical protein
LLDLAKVLLIKNPALKGELFTKKVSPNKLIVTKRVFQLDGERRLDIVE